MKKETLTALGLTEEQAASVLSVVNSELKDYVKKSDYDALDTQLKDTVPKADYDKLKKDLAAFDGVDVDALNVKITDLEGSIKAIKTDYAVERALTAANARNIKAAKALLNLEGAELLEDGTVKDLDDQIKKLAEDSSTSFLFSKEDPQPFKGLPPREGGDDPAKSDPKTYEDFEKLYPMN